MKLYLGDDKSVGDRVAVKHIRKYLRQLEASLKSGNSHVEEFEISNHLDEIGNAEINRRYSPTGRRTLKIVYYDKGARVAIPRGIKEGRNK